MENLGEKTQRAATIENVNIDLIEHDPYERLKEFCKKGFYYYKWSWDKFNNGILCDLELRYKFMNNKRVAVKETKFLYTTDLAVAQQIVCTSLLERIGLNYTPTKKLSWAEISSCLV